MILRGRELQTPYLSAMIARWMSAAVVSAAVVGGCSSDPWSSGGGGGGGQGAAGEQAVAVDPALLPERIIIHPLTRVGADAQGRPALICHIELRDRFGQNIKALGRLRVELYKPSTDPAVSTQTQDLVWDVDITQPERNARLYDDLITRTYTLTLGGLPPWLIDWSDSRGRGSTASAPSLKAAFTTDDARTGGGVLSTSYQMSR